MDMDTRRLPQRQDIEILQHLQAQATGNLLRRRRLVTVTVTLQSLQRVPRQYQVIHTPQADRFHPAPPKPSHLLTRRRAPVSIPPQIVNAGASTISTLITTP